MTPCPGIVRKGWLTINNIIQVMLQVLYPVRCIVCGRVLWQEEHGVCRECLHRIPLITGNRCLMCSKQIEAGDVYCRDCSRKKHAYESGYAMWSYNNISRKVIADIKYSGRRDGIRYIAGELAYHAGILCRAWRVAAVIPVPLHKKKLRRRGFNQAAVIAEAFASELGLQYIDDVLFRIRNTKPQKYFDDKGRVRNLKMAFGVREDIMEKYRNIKNVILIDDIYTSGSTIDECTMVLKEAGIKKVYFICLCIGDGY